MSYWCRQKIVVSLLFFILKDMNMKYEMKGSVHGHDFKIIAGGKGRPYE